MDEDELERLAREELVREAKQAAARAEVVGPQGWQKCPLPPTNKRFLQNTLLSALNANSKPIHKGHRHSSQKRTVARNEKNARTQSPKHPHDFQQQSLKENDQKDSTSRKHEKKS